METIELKITPPEGYEIDKENSTFEAIKLRKKTVITYDDVARKVFGTQSIYIPDSIGQVAIRDNQCIYCRNNSPTFEQVVHVLALNQLFNIARFYNGDWRPNGEDKAYYIYLSGLTKEYYVDYTLSCVYGIPFFKNMADTQAVIGNPNFRPILDAIYKNY